MEFSEVVRNRKSVRDYDATKDVTDAQLEELFELVKFSPSSYNLQPWEFVVVRDPENKKRLRECANGQKHVEDASATIIVLGSMKPSRHAEDVAEDRMKKGTMDAAKKKRFDAAVKSLSENKEKSRLWATRSTSLAAMTLMLAAKNMGLATCPMEGFNAECIKKEFGIPDYYEIVMLITLGYESKPKPRLMRYGYYDIVHIERYGKPFKR